MKRNAAVFGLFALLALFISPWLVQAQAPAQRVIIVDKTGLHAASVSGGNLGTAGSASVTVDTISHITSALHVAGIANTVLVNCVAGCAGAGSHTAVSQTAAPWNIAHIAAMVHVQISGRPGMAAHQAGTWTVDIGNGTVAISGGTVQAAQSGAWNVSAAQSGLWSIASAHIVGGSGHLAITFAGGGHVAVSQANAWTVAATQSGVWSVGQSATAWTIAHISSATHIVGTVTCTNCTGGSSDAVNVFHQSTIRHVSSVTHVSVVDLRGAHVGAAQSGVWNVTAHQGGTWTVGISPNVGHLAGTQAGQWTVAHISSALHIAGTVSVNCVVGCGASAPHTAVTQAAQPWTVAHISSVLHVNIRALPRDAHMGVAQSGAWVITAHQSVTPWTIAHISSVLHVVVADFPRGAHVAAAQSGSWTIQAAHQGGQWTIAHNSGSLHVAGTIKGAQFHVQGLGIPGQAHGGVLTIQGVAGGVAVPISGTISTDTVNVFHQSTIRHVSSVTHVAGAIIIQNIAGTAVTVTGTALDVNCTGCSAAAVTAISHISASVHVAGISNIGTGFTTATTRMACHSSVAFSLTADGVIAHANSGMQIFICSIVLVTAGAENISIVEGSGAACATGKIGMMGGAGGTMAMAANGGFSSISPFPWLHSTISGNAVCLDKSGSTNVSGVITYRGAP